MRRLHAPQDPPSTRGVTTGIAAGNGYPFPATPKVHPLHHCLFLRLRYRPFGSQVPGPCQRQAASWATRAWGPAPRGNRPEGPAAVPTAPPIRQVPLWVAQACHGGLFGRAIDTFWTLSRPRFTSHGRPGLNPTPIGSCPAGQIARRSDSATLAGACASWTPVGTALGELFGYLPTTTAFSLCWERAARARPRHRQLQLPQRRVAPPPYRLDEALRPPRPRPPSPSATTTSAAPATTSDPEETRPC